MRIEHVAIWSRDIEGLREFYCRHFGCVAGARYENPRTGFSSYFLRFGDGARLEIMQQPGIDDDGRPAVCGLAHFAVSVGSEEAVRSLTAKLQAQGVRVSGEPRWTGDGYFESVVLDPDGNPIEITI